MSQISITIYNHLRGILFLALVALGSCTFREHAFNIMQVKSQSDLTVYNSEESQECVKQLKKTKSQIQQTVNELAVVAEGAEESATRYELKLKKSGIKLIQVGLSQSAK